MEYSRQIKLTGIIYLLQIEYYVAYCKGIKMEPRGVEPHFYVI
jgi:hypothetical protein